MSIRTIITILLAVWISGCALSRDVVYLDDRIDVVERKIARQSDTVDGHSRTLKGDYARLNNRMDQLAEQVRRIDGRFEESGYAQEQNRTALARLQSEIDRLDRLLSDLTRRLGHVESYVGYEATKTPSVAARPADGTGTAKLSETQLYDEGQSALDKDDFQRARDAFGRLLRDFPKSSHADNAQFWIGESYYREKWYQKAILEYQKVIENYPGGNKVAGAYLKQGLSFFELGEAENARLILNELLKKFPKSGEAGLAKKKLDSHAGK
ncbi:tol-pal system protein YbgF [Desulfatiferula olefinivorans]